MNGYKDMNDEVKSQNGAYDVMVGWSDWKDYLIHSSSGPRYCENLKMIADSVYEIFSTQNSIFWPLTFICSTKMASYQLDVMIYVCLITLHMHTKSGLNWTQCCWDTKQREIWPLAFICIAKMALNQFHLIMRFDCLVTLHMHTKFGHNWTNGWWDTKQREIWPLTFICITKMAAYQRDLIRQYDCGHTPYAYKNWAPSDKRLLR